MKTLSKFIAATSVALFLLIPAVALASKNATVKIVHGIRGLDLGTADALPVDVYVNGGLVLEDFTFGSIETAELPAGTYDIDITLANDPNPVISQSVSFKKREKATVIAHLTADGAPTASKYRNYQSRWFFGPFVPVTLHHTAAAPAVDVYAQSFFGFFRVARGLENPDRQFTILNTRRSTVAVVPANTLNVVLGPAQLPLNRRNNYAVYVVGSANGLAGNTLTAIVLEF